MRALEVSPNEEDGGGLAEAGTSEVQAASGKLGVGVLGVQAQEEVEI